MGQLDAIVHLVLYACFAVYVLMGLILLVMGVVYMGDAGAVGTTGVYLCIVGFCMLVVGGIACFANWKQLWFLLFIIELFNIGLFLGLYVMIVAVLMMASGTTDPVRRATDEGWDHILKTVTIPGSGEGDATFCETQITLPGSIDDCTGWYERAAYGDDTCPIGETGQPTVTEVTNNCSMLQSNGLVGGGYIGGMGSDCSNLLAYCQTCVSTCKEQIVADVKDSLEPAVICCAAITCFIVVVSIYNNILVSSNNELEGTALYTGLTLNGLLVFASFIFIVVGILGWVEAKDTCPAGADDCMPRAVYFTVILGFSVFGVGITATGGVYLSNHFLLRVATAVLVLLGVFLVLVGMILGISSGTVMEDMSYYYDVNYPRLRNALESVDASYCRMTDEECLALVKDGVPVYPKDADGNVIDGVPPMTRESTWINQHAAVAKAANQDPHESWLDPCATTGVCVFCDTFFERVSSRPSGAVNLNFSNVLGGNDGLQFRECAGPVPSSNCANTAPASNKKTILTRMQPGTAPAAEWTNQISNYTRYDNIARSTMGNCNAALIELTRDSQYCPDDAATSTTLVEGSSVGRTFSYQGDCQQCANSVLRPFFFDLVSGDNIDQTKCLNFFVGHMMNECGASSYHPLQCKELFYGASTPPTDADRAIHINKMILLSKDDESHDEAHKFCSYDTASCKAKIKETIESSMSTIGTIGAIFLTFFVAILWFTEHAIKVYMGGSGDDEDEDLAADSDTFETEMADG